MEQRQRQQVACRCAGLGAEQPVAGLAAFSTRLACDELGALGLPGGAAACRGSPRCRSSSVTTVSNVGGWSGHRLAERLRRPRSATPARRVGGDQEEVLAARRRAPKPGVPLVAHRQLGGALEAEVRLRVGVVEVVGDLAGLEQHVERHDDGAGLEDAVVDDREVRQVRAGQRDLVAGLDAASTPAGWRPGWRRRRPARTSAGCRRAHRVAVGYGRALSSSRIDRFSMRPTSSDRGRSRTVDRVQRGPRSDRTRRRASRSLPDRAGRDAAAGAHGRRPGSGTVEAAHRRAIRQPLPIAANAQGQVASDAAPVAGLGRRRGTARSSVISIRRLDPADHGVVAPGRGRRAGSASRSSSGHRQQRRLPLRSVARVDEVA